MQFYYITGKRNEKKNLVESQKLQVLYHKKHVKKCLYWPEDSIR